MNKLVVSRRSEWANRARKIGLYLNDKKIDTVGNGESKEFTLEPGDYKLKAKIDWCGSQVHHFEIKAIQHQEYNHRNVLLSLS